MSAAPRICIVNAFMVVVDVANQMVSKLLYAEDLVLMSELMEELMNNFSSKVSFESEILTVTHANKNLLVGCGIAKA